MTEQFDLASVDHVLTTTRTVRKRLDPAVPVDLDDIRESLRIAAQAPTGGNAQGWRWLVVTDAGKRRAIADIYAKGARPYLEANAALVPDGNAQQRRVVDSAMHLLDIMADIPVHIIPCILGRLDTAAAEGHAPMSNALASGFYGSAWPAVWSLMLALRARGYGSALTTLHLIHEQEAAELLGIPDTVTQVGLLPVARYTGDGFKPAKRRPVEEITYWNGWKQRA